MMEYFGNKTLLDEYKVGFLCSRKVPASIVLKSYDWAKEQRKKKICVVIGNHSQIEKDVFQILLMGKQPLILVLARGMLKRVDIIIKNEIDNNRLLVIAPFTNSIIRVTSETAERRNKYITEISDSLIIGYMSKNGMLERNLKNENIKYNVLAELEDR